MRLLIRLFFMMIPVISCLSCKMHNARCMYNESGILSVRNDGSVINFVYLGDNGSGKISSFVMLNGKSIDEDNIKNSIEVFNVFDASGRTYTWGGVSLTPWETGTKLYSCKGGLAFWILKERLVGFEVFPEVLSKTNGINIEINGKPVNAMQYQDFKVILGSSLKERRYWSEF